MSVPSLTRVCVNKIVNEIELFCRGVDFQELGNYSQILGPLENLSSTCIQSIFNYVIRVRRLNQAWLSVLIVAHLKTLNLTNCPDIIDNNLFETLILRCQHLEELLIPYCKKISNDSLCKLLRLNPSLLALDISNKLTPCIDQEVMRTIVYSCRYLTVLKLSDYRLDDPQSLLVLCGKRVVPASSSNSAKSLVSPVRSKNSVCQVSEREPSSVLLNSNSMMTEREGEELMERVNNLFLPEEETCGGERSGLGARGAQCTSSSSSWEEGRNERIGSGMRNAIAVYVTSQSNSNETSGSNNNNMEVAMESRKWVGSRPQQERGEEQGEQKEEEREDRMDADGEDGHQDGENQSGEEEEEEEEEEELDLYEDDSSVSALEVEDHSREFGCLELETLWLENVNLTDQVAAILLQSLCHLRDINLSDTDICNPWRLIRPSECVHLRYLEDLDVKSTALSRTALVMIPDFHPDLQKLSISSTTLPPPTYANIARLSGIAELELIGGQFYPCEPEEIFTNGIIPAVSGVGEHLQSLNLTYFAHIEFRKIILSCPIIRHLDLSRTDIFVTCPCPSVGEHCPHLTNLNLDYAHIEARDGSSNQLVPEEKVVQQMIGEPRVLEEAFLCGLTISDECIRTMFPGARYPLRVLKVSRCKKLTIAGVQHLWNKCPLLTGIDMTHCKDITVTDYKAFSEDCQGRPTFKLEGLLEWK